MRGNALVEALAQLARRAAFYQLRTVEQLGYIVFLSAWSNELVRSLVRPRAASMSNVGMFPASISQQGSGYRTKFIVRFCDWNAARRLALSSADRFEQLQCRPDSKIRVDASESSHPQVRGVSEMK